MVAIFCEFIVFARPWIFLGIPWQGSCIAKCILTSRVNTALEVKRTFMEKKDRILLNSSIGIFVTIGQNQ